MRFRFAIIAGLTAMAAVPLNAEQSAERIAITPQSEKGLLVLHTAQLPAAPRVVSQFHLYLGAYDPVEGIITVNFFDSRNRFEAQPKYYVGDYLVMDIDPGTYVIKSFDRQDHWSICYNAETVQFTVQAGQALYLGKFESQRSLASLQLMAIATDQLRTMGGLITFYDSPGPFVSGLDEEGLSRAQDMALTNLALTTSRLQLVEYTPARFTTGLSRGLNRRTCGSRSLDLPPGE